jgi:hypothetical protein
MPPLIPPKPCNGRDPARSNLLRQVRAVLSRKFVRRQTSLSARNEVLLPIAPFARTYPWFALPAIAVWPALISFNIAFITFGLWEVKQPVLRQHKQI